MVILAHAVVPHHHHNGIIVALFESHSTDGSENHDHDHDHHHGSKPHHHESSGGIEKCALNEVYTRSDSSPKFVCHENCDCGQTLFFVVPGIINKLNLADEVGLPFRQRPYIESYHSIFSSGSIGLRAPPVC